MGSRYISFVPGEVYHICSRGVDQRLIFLDDHDRHRFLKLLHHCLPIGRIVSFSIAQRLKQPSCQVAEGQGLVDVLAYCLMSNHIHLLLRENVDTGTTLYMQRLLNSYARYFNTRHHRTGPLFSGRFRAVSIDGDEQLLHVSRYIHLNPYVARIVRRPSAYRWSSLMEYINPGIVGGRCHVSLLGSMMSPPEYQKFVVDHADYARTLGDIKHLLLEEESKSH